MHKLLSKVGVFVTVYGYARVSTDGQSLASQDAELARRRLRQGL